MCTGIRSLNPDEYRSQCERTIALFERLGIAIVPSPLRRKGSFVEGWQSIPVNEAISITQRELQSKLVGLAGRTGHDTAVFDLDGRNGVEPGEMLAVLRGLVGPAIIAIVATSRGFHVWARVVGSVGNGFCSFIGGEIFSGPHLAMLPPSIHPSGQPYVWDVEPRVPEAAVSLRALGLVPDRPSTASPASGARGVESATPDVQREFADLMSEVGVLRVGERAQTLSLCPWHPDRSPSLSVNWDAAVYYCFSERCQARGGIASLCRRVCGDTPTYRQWTESDAEDVEEAADHRPGDKWGCADVDAATERLAAALEELGFDERARSVRDCRVVFRVGKCTNCARTPAFPISCADQFCIRCMPGRLISDWKRHSNAVPSELTLLELRPRDLALERGALRKTRNRFRDWRARSGVTAGVYGVRLDRQFGAVVLLAVPADGPMPASSTSFEVKVVGRRKNPMQFIWWFCTEYVREAQLWETAQELALFAEETKGRRRFQGFGNVYGKGSEDETMDEKHDDSKTDAGSGEHGRRRLGRISGGSCRSKTKAGAPSCPFCGGDVELYPFTVRIADVRKVGDAWLWNGPSGGTADQRRPSR